VALEWTYHLGPVNIAHGPAPVDLFSLAQGSSFPVRGAASRNDDKERSR
jgi:hypothetical protein